MNNNNLQKRYFSPKRVFLFSVVALVHVWYAASAKLDRSSMTGKRKYEASKVSDGAVNDDIIIDSVYSKNGAEESDEPKNSEYVDDFNFPPETFKDIHKDVASSVGEDPVFRDIINERRGNRDFGIPVKGDFDEEEVINVYSENDTNETIGSEPESFDSWPGFDTDPFNRNRGSFGEDKNYEIPGLSKSSAVMTKFSTFFYILILSVFLFVKMGVFV